MVSPEYGGRMRAVALRGKMSIGSIEDKKIPRHKFFRRQQPPQKRQEPAKVLMSL
jgi:hypothetical protein